jgi:hypothetical protein
VYCFEWQGVGGASLDPTTRLACVLLVVWVLSGRKNAAQVLSGCRHISSGWQTRSVAATLPWPPRQGAHAVLLHVYVTACLPPRQLCSD